MMEDGFTEAEVHHASSDNMIVPEHQTVINPVWNILSSAEYSLVRLVMPNTEELISQPLEGL